MNSEAIVCVPYAASNKNADVTAIVEDLQREHPDGFAECISDTAFAVGLYDWASIAVSLNRQASVPEESQQMADALDKRGTHVDIVAQVRRSNTRLEIVWHLGEDRDGECIFNYARIFAGLTGGIALFGGNRPFSPEFDAYSPIFPK